MSPEYHNIGRYDIAAHKACRAAGLTVEQLEGGAVEKAMVALRAVKTWNDSRKHYQDELDIDTSDLVNAALAGGKEEGR